MLDAAAITQLFILFNAGDKKLINSLNEHNTNSIQGSQWHFSLEQLCSFYQTFYQLEPIAYLSFRKVLFNSPINHELKSLGLCISIAKPAKNVDQTIYCLRKLDL